MTRWIVRGATRSFRLMSVAPRVRSTCPRLRLLLPAIVIERSAFVINPLNIATVILAVVQKKKEEKRIKNQRR